MRPLARDLRGRVGCVRHDVVLLARGSRSLAFALDGHHSLDETVHLGLGLRLRRLHHQRLVYGERERRGVEAVVHEPVGYVAAVDAVVVLEVGEVEDHLVPHTACFARIVCAELACEGRRHVVGVDYGHLRRMAQALLTQHLDISVGYRQQHGGSPRCRRYGSDAVIAARGDDGMRRQEGLKVFGHADGAYARAAAAVRHGEGLV